MKALRFALFLTPILLMVTEATSTAQVANGGWFISAGGGLSQNDNGPFSRRLQSYTPKHEEGENFTYQTEPFASVGHSLNVSAGALLGERIIVGASGELLFFPSIESVTPPGSPRDQYTLSGSGAGLDIGYALVNEAGTLVYPYLHAGYYGYSLQYQNNQTEAIPFFEGTSVAAGSSATYTGAAPRIGLGVGMTRFFNGIGNFGLLINARLLYGRMLSRPEWEQNGTTVTNGGHTPQYNSITLSLGIGLGSL